MRNVADRAHTKGRNEETSPSNDDRMKRERAGRNLSVVSYQPPENLTRGGIPKPPQL